MDYKIVKVKGLDMAVYKPDEKIQSLWVQGRFYETQRNGLLAYLFANRYNGRMLDIGASIGNHTVYCSKVLGMKVVAIEPTKHVYDHLMVNLKLNKLKVETHNVALGMNRGKVSMINLSQGANIGMYNVCDGDDTKMVMLDDIVDQQFDVIKIDVENYNTEVLIGGSDFFIKQKHAHVFVECESKISLNETGWLLQKYGYKREPIQLNHTPTYLWTKL